ncbi:LdhB [Desulfamplus magnetovallimortis]|uniref:Glycolate oxidase iron-sulfur subunit n=1 Tax=Desulfamplus magnetovallimortis TaxID=1246637 RepID=A0A1W1HCQ8_9BACT|nr:(Fe-S)-binding protein [Desulfamplus magnetovallimortis]SLM30274.1 LdhB [Desulfamplus magnetovallimortis]
MVEIKKTVPKMGTKSEAGMKKLANRLKELEDQLVVCIRCGMCQSVCPLFEQTRREADVARGKLALLDGLGKNLFTDPDGVDERLNKCLLCGSCAANCPSGVNVVEIFIKARAILAEFKGLSPMKKLIFRKMLANPSTFDNLTEWAGKFQGIFTKDEKNAQGTSCARLVAPLISPLINDRHILPMAAKPLHKTTPMINTAPGRSGLKAAIFTGCIIDKIFPAIGHDLIDIFKYHGVGTYIPQGEGCCGIPALASGDMATFEKLVEYHIKLFDQEQFDYLITACATCTSTIKKLWPSIYEGKSSGIREKIGRLSEKTLDINQFLVNKVSFSNDTQGIKSENFNQNNVRKTRVTYHDPCHLKKSLGVISEPRDVIRASGKELVEMEGSDKCCGMGGSFNLYHYGISSKIGNLKQKNIADTGCDTVATGCPACMVQISDMLAKEHLDIKVRHPIQLYADFLREQKLI